MPEALPMSESVADTSGRRLSSSLTFAYKFVFSTLWVAVFAAVTASMFAAPGAWHGNGDVRQLRWVFAAATLLGGSLFWFACMRNKKVELDLGRKVFSILNYRRTIEVPIRDIEAVSGSLLLNPELIWLRFRRPTGFGSKIVFMPRLRFLHGFTRHPLVEELRALVANPANHA
jgi:hypothetical protein